MSIANLIRLLSFGFSGVALALTLLSYQLLRAEQKKRTPNADVLRRIEQFGRRALLIAILVAAVQLTELVVRRLTFNLPAAPAVIADCRDSLSFLGAQKDVGSPEALKAAVEKHTAACADLLTRIDQEAGR